MGQTVPHSSRSALTVAVSYWQPQDGICEMLCHELAELNYQAEPFAYGTPIPDSADLLLSFGPYGALLPIWQQAAELSRARPLTILHWNTEGMPDLRWPAGLVRFLSRERSRVGRLATGVDSHNAVMQRLRSFLATRMLRFQNTGDYEYAFRRGWLHVLADSSAIYAQLRTSRGLPTIYAPWGATALWYDDFHLERDIDVLWMGTRGSYRRSRHLDRIHHALTAHGVRMHVADNIKNPFIYKQDRTHYLNRAKITLNLTRTWYDDNYSRFAMAVPNRSLMVSEPLLAHCPDFVPGKHYVSAPVGQLVDVILHYLQRADERRQIVECAYEMVKTKLAFRHSLARMLEAAFQHRLGQAPSGAQAVVQA
jgi:hypothetical protein